MYFQALTVLVVGWALGWLVARSLVFEPFRNVVSGVASVLSEGHGDPPDVRFLSKAASYPMRFLAGVMHCAACSGFWLGCGLSLAGSYVGLHSPWGTLVTGFAVMGTNALADAYLAALISALERNSREH